MTEKTKLTYYYELATERDEAEAKRQFKTLSGFTLKEHTEDQCKGIGKMVFVKSSSGKAANA